MLMFVSVLKKKIWNIFDEGVFIYIWLNLNFGFKKFWGYKKCICI